MCPPRFGPDRPVNSRHRINKAAFRQRSASGPVNLSPREQRRGLLPLRTVGAIRQQADDFGEEIASGPDTFAVAALPTIAEICHADSKLQSSRGQQMEERAGTGTLNTALVEAGGEVFSRSNAILRILRELGGGWRVLSVLGRCIPGPVRDWAYNFIAARRHRWFGKGDACAMPSEALRERLM